MNLFIASTSKENISEEIVKQSKKLIKKLAKIPKINLIFGAYHKGLMKVCYDEFFKNKKDIIGVSTEFDKENCDIENYTEEIIVKKTTERFEKIYEKSDCLLFLPGGIGTLAELFSSLEEERINKKKKIIVYNCNFFFTPIIEELYNLYQEGFIDTKPADYMIIESDLEKIIEIIKEDN